MRRCVLALLRPPVWVPPGVSPEQWRRVLAEDTVDLLATLAEVEVGMVATAEDVPLAESVRWPGTPVLTVQRPTPVQAFAAAYREGFDQAAVIVCDAPDLPAMLIGKLLQPLGRRQVAAAPSGAALLGIAATLPAPEWLTRTDPDLDTTDVAGLRAAAGRPGQVAATPGWHRLHGPEGFARLDPDVEGWDATRALLSAGDASPY